MLFIVAGHETIATALTYALYALGHHRQVQQRVAAEVAELGTGPATADDIPRLGCTVQVLREAMRLCPPTAALGRMIMRDIAVDGYRVEAGTLALCRSSPCTTTRICGPTRSPSTPTGSPPQDLRPAGGGIICPSALGRVAAWAITSPCRKRRWRWQALSATWSFGRYRETSHHGTADRHSSGSRACVGQTPRSRRIVVLTQGIQTSVTRNHYFPLRFEVVGWDLWLPFFSDAEGSAGVEPLTLEKSIGTKRWQQRFHRLACKRARQQKALRAIAIEIE